MQMGYRDVHHSRPIFTLLLSFTRSRSPTEVQVCSQIFSGNMAIFSSRSSNLAEIFVKKLKFVLKNINSQACFLTKSAYKPPISLQFVCSRDPDLEIRATCRGLPTRKKKKKGCLSYKSPSPVVLPYFVVFVDP